MITGGPGVESLGGLDRVRCGAHRATAVLGSYGYNDAARVVASVDGVDLSSLWVEVNQALDEWNAHRAALTALLSYPTVNVADAVPQVSDGALASFQEASEYGEPTGIRPGGFLTLGYDFRDFDLAARYTWMFLRDSSAEQIRAVTSYALAADNKLTSGLILKRLFDPAPVTTASGHTAYGLWNADGMVPPDSQGQVFDNTHTHYVASGSSKIDSGDIEDSIKHVRQHSYAVTPGSKLICPVHPDEAEEISAFRAGEENNNGRKAKWTFVPSVASPPFVTPDNIVGQQVSGESAGLEILGSYGPALVTESYACPSGYVLTFATYGPDNPSNVIGVRQHVNPLYQGLRILPGNDRLYPLTDSFFCRSLGCGCRHRGGAVVTQLTTGSYTVPSIQQ